MNIPPPPQLSRLTTALNLPASLLARVQLKLANCEREPGTEEIVLSCVSYCQN